MIRQNSAGSDEEQFNLTNAQEFNNDHQTGSRSKSISFQQKPYKNLNKDLQSTEKKNQNLLKGFRMRHSNIKVSNPGKNQGKFKVLQAKAYSMTENGGSLTLSLPEPVSG